jgi:hypothetical protein
MELWLLSGQCTRVNSVSMNPMSKAFLVNCKRYPPMFSKLFLTPKHILRLYHIETFSSLRLDLFMGYPVSLS